MSQRPLLILLWLYLFKINIKNINIWTFDLRPLHWSSLFFYCHCFLISPFVQNLSFIPPFHFHLLLFISLSCNLPPSPSPPPPPVLPAPLFCFFQPIFSTPPPPLSPSLVFFLHSLFFHAPPPLSPPLSSFPPVDEISLLEGLTIVYKSSIDLFFYVVGSVQENEVSSATSSGFLSLQELNDLRLYRE